MSTRSAPGIEEHPAEQPDDSPDRLLPPQIVFVRISRHDGPS